MAPTSCKFFLIFSFMVFSEGSLAFAVDREVPVGAPNTSYASVEFTKDGCYMVWYEGVYGNARGQMWHCAVDPDTGALTPPDGRGFKAFPTTAFGRGNVGCDAKGPFYVGANPAGEVYMVRPTGAQSGEMTKLAAPADPWRKGYYPTQNEHEEKAYLVWETMNGRTRSNRQSHSSTLQYIDLSEPSNVYTIETQQKPKRLRLTPMDIAFFRVVNGAPLVTYGAFDENYKVQIKMKDLSKPDEPARFVTKGDHSHVDPYGFVDSEGTLYLVSGINAKALMYVYKYDKTKGLFEKQSEIAPPSGTALKNPTMATSFEPVFHNGHIYGAYQINDHEADTNESGDPNGYIKTAFQQPGEIWLTDITDPSWPQLKLSGDTGIVRTEPEPLVGQDEIWLFYNTAETGQTIMNATWQLRKSAVLLP